MEIAANDLEGAHIVDVVDMSTGGPDDRRQQRTHNTTAQLGGDAGINDFEIFFPERDDVALTISTPSFKDPVKAQNEA